VEFNALPEVKGEHPGVLRDFPRSGQRRPQLHSISISMDQGFIRHVNYTLLSGILNMGIQGRNAGMIEGNIKGVDIPCTGFDSQSIQTPY
jgi:hypothetical protein